MPSWTDIENGWSDGWKALKGESLRMYQSAIEANPAAFAEKVKVFVAELLQARANLDSIRSKLPSPPSNAEEHALFAKYATLEKRYHDLAAGFYSDVKPSTDNVGALPVLIIAGVVIGVAAIAWAVAAWEYCVNLREQTALADKELVARVEASEQGRTLQPTTLPEPASEQAKKDAGGIGALLLSGLVLAAGAVAIPVFLKRKGGS